MSSGTRLAVACVLVLVAGLDVACSSGGNDSLRDMLMQQLPEEAKSGAFIMPNYLPAGTDPEFGILPYPPDGISVFFFSLNHPGIQINIVETLIIGTGTAGPLRDPAIPTLSSTVKATVINGRDVRVRTTEHSTRAQTDIGTISVSVQVDDPYETLSLSDLEREAEAIVQSMVDS